jgi:hypothetical protein
MLGDADRPTSNFTTFINAPDFPLALQVFIHEQNHPDSSQPMPLDNSFDGPIHVFHSAKVHLYAPSDLCGTGGMLRETICANPDYCGSRHFDTVFVSIGNEEDVMNGLLVAQVKLLFSFFDPYHGKDVPCALVTWFTNPDGGAERDIQTGMWRLLRERGVDGKCPLQVIHLDAILRGVHLLPHYGDGVLPVGLSSNDALDAWDAYLVNQFIDYHAHWLLTHSK